MVRITCQVVAVMDGFPQRQRLSQEEDEESPGSLPQRAQGD